MTAPPDSIKGLKERTSIVNINLKNSCVDHQQVQKEERGESGKTISAIHLKKGKLIRSYDTISSEFKGLLAITLKNTSELIAEMYDSLTITQGFKHRAAVKKIIEDHKELPGFSERSIQRALPSDNPIVPRRVVPKWRKSSNSKLPCTTNVSITKISTGIQNEPILGEVASNPVPHARLIFTDKDILEEKYDVFVVPKAKLESIKEAGEKCKEEIYLFFLPEFRQLDHAEPDK